ncbi:MAG: YfhO family protein [Acidobacteriota bacterium]
MDGWSLLDALPGAWFLALALLLVVIVRRTYDPLPRRIALLAVLLPLGLFAPSLLAGRVQVPVDFLLAFDPWRQVESPGAAAHPLQGDLPLLLQPAVQKVRSETAAGRWPLWNEAVGAGMPLLADPQAQAFQPLLLVGYPLAIRAGPAVAAALKVLLAFLFSFLLLRRQGLTSAAAVIGAIAFALSGFVVLWSGWPLGTTAVWLPVVLYGLLRTESEPRTADRCLLVAAWLGLLLSGHPQGIAFSCCGVALFAASRLWNSSTARTPTALRWLGLGAIAGALAAPVLLPAWQAIAQSERQAVLERLNPSLPHLGEAGEGSSERLAARLAPDSLGDHRWGSYWGPVNSLEDGGAFVSTTVLVLALTAFGRRQRRPQEVAAGWGTVAALALTLLPPALVAPLPVVGFLFRLGPQRLLGVAAFGLCYVAACALDRWLRGEEIRKTGVVLAGLLAAGILWAFLAHPPPAGRDPLTALRNLSLALQLGLLGAAAALLLARRGRPRIAWVLCALVGTELLVAHGPANPSVPEELATLLGAGAPAKRVAPGESAPAKRVAPGEREGSKKRVAPGETTEIPPELSEPLRWLREHAGGDRVVGLGLALPPNTASFWGLSDPRVNNPLEPAAYRRALRSLHAGAQAWELGRAESPLWDLLNVRYFLAPRGQPQPAPLALRLRHPSGWVWERPTALRRFFLPRAVETYRGGSWPDWLAANPDFAAIALVQSDGSARQEERWRADATGANLFFKEHDAAHWTVEFSAPEERFWASSLYQDGGWNLLLNEHPHPWLLANGPFLGAWIPAGTHRLTLLYRPRLHAFGCLLAALGLTLFANAARPRSKIPTTAEWPGRSR